MACSYRGCGDPAVASVLAGATRINVCFTHEREYADRYGAADIHALVSASPVHQSPFVRAALAGSLTPKALSIEPYL